MNKFIPIIVSTLFFSCSVTKPAKQFIYDELTENFIFSPSSLKNEISEGLNLEIEPIDAKLMDKISFEKHNLSGNYKKIFSDITLLEQKLKNDKLTSNERYNLLTLKQRVEYINQMINDKG